MFPFFSRQRSPEVEPAGGIFRWGRNNAGQLGDGTITSRSSPVQMGALTTWTAAIQSQNYASTALKNDGTIWCVGLNDKGQLGDGTTTDRSSPVQVGDRTVWVAIGHGSFANTHFGIESGGKLWVWGSGGYGANGKGNTTHYSSPVQIGSQTDWEKVHIGTGGVHAIKTSGKLYAWGSNASGMLGTGNTTYYSSPVQIGSQTDWDVVVPGNRATHGLKNTGKLYSWGLNNKGQLGHGNTTTLSSPVQVGSASNWTSIGASNGFMAAINSDGKLYACGNASGGGTAQGNTTNLSTLTQVGSLTNWGTLSCGSGALQSVKTDGTLWSWGAANYGMLGDGQATTSRSSPVQIGSSTSWKPFNSSLGHIHGGIILA